MFPCDFLLSLGLKDRLESVIDTMDESPENTSVAGALDLAGGDLCLDFTNTVSSRGAPGEHDYLDSYDDLLAWGAHAGALDGGVAARLGEAAAVRADEARAVLARARALREALYRIFAAHAAGRIPAPGDLALLNTELSRALAQRRIAHAAGAFAWEWEERRPALDRVLWPVALAAADLLVSGELARVHQCENGTCGWLFVDRSKNRSRRWCSMKDCGNVTKVRRYRSKHKHDD